MDWLHVATNSKDLIDTKFLKVICSKAKYSFPPESSSVGVSDFLSDIVDCRDLCDIYLSSGAYEASSSTIREVVNKFTFSYGSNHHDNEKRSSGEMREFVLQNILAAIENRIIASAQGKKDPSLLAKEPPKNGEYWSKHQQNLKDYSLGDTSLEFFVATSMSMSLASALGLPDEFRVTTMTYMTTSLLDLLALTLRNSNGKYALEMGNDDSIDPVPKAIYENRNTCKNCGLKLESRNKLFKHIESCTSASADTNRYISFMLVLSTLTIVSIITMCLQRQRRK